MRDRILPPAKGYLPECEAGKPDAASDSTRNCALRSVDESSRDTHHVVSAALAGAGGGLRVSDGGGSGHRPRIAGHGVGVASYAAVGRAGTGDRSSRLRAD